VNERKEMWCCLRDMQNGNGKKICLFCFNYQCWAVCFIDSIFIEYPLLYLWDFEMALTFVLLWVLGWWWWWVARAARELGAYTMPSEFLHVTFTFCHSHVNLAVPYRPRCAARVRNGWSLNKYEILLDFFQISLGLYQKFFWLTNPQQFHTKILS
jgi:hypothetical protein